MTRTYFNGVSKVSSSGNTISFVIDDTSEYSKESVKKEEIIHLISEIDAVEGICRYMLSEIEKIKNFNQNNQDNLPEDLNQTIRTEKTKPSLEKNKTHPLPLGLKLKTSDADHLD